MKRTYKTLLFLCPALLSAQVVNTAYGPVEGVTVDGVRAFLGMPYAAPPAGELRFSATAPPEPWDAPRPANAMAPPCPQIDREGNLTGSEDCLYVNVWAREGVTNAPVLFFIHGGANVRGAASLPLYDGSRIAAAKDVVMVTVQYRLGALGNLVHPAIPGGNYGLLDLVSALEWVRDNIAAFGGDPSRVMVFGESAGAVNTCMLVASPLGAGLFSRALMQSGGCVAASKERATELGVRLAEELGCADAACLRSASAEAIVTAQGGEQVGTDGTLAFGFGPSVDGIVLPAAPLDLIAEGQHNRVPFAIGANADETAAFVLPLTEAAYRAGVLRIFGDVLGARVLLEYPAGAYGSPREAMVAVTTDSQFVCPSRAIASTVARAQYEPVYRYFFTHAPSARGAIHGLELAYLFQRIEEDAMPEDLAVERTVLEYWTNFAESGNPNEVGLVRWPMYFPAIDSYLELAAPPRPGAGVRTEKCDFWDRLRGLAGPR